MNERIAELANQSGFDVDKTGKFGNYSEMTRLEKFAELIILECANNLVQANMSNPDYARAMDAYYEQKWAHRFD